VQTQAANTVDLAVVQRPGQKCELHTANCPVARNAAAAGYPVMTMWGCNRMDALEEGRRFTIHDCLRR
jgi:hypothetical protein